MVTSRFGIPMVGLLPLPPRPYRQSVLVLMTSRIKPLERESVPRTNVHTRFGRPVPVGPPDAEPSEERVEEVFCKYLAELRSKAES